MPHAPIFDGNLDIGFQLGELHALPSPTGGWDVFPTTDIIDNRVAWFATVVEALRFLKAKDDSNRNAYAAAAFVRWGLTERKRKEK